MCGTSYLFQRVLNLVDSLQLVGVGNPFLVKGGAKNHCKVNLVFTHSFKFFIFIASKFTTR